MAVLDVIKFDGFADGKPWVAYKYPGDQITLGAQLIVNPGQEAVFIKGGEICDIFESGTYTLQTGNLPLLGKLVKLPFGGKTPFSAEIFFINRAAKLDMTWGTATPFQLEDAKYGIIVSIRAHGKYGIRIVNPTLFLGELIGSAPSDTVFTPAFVNSFFNSMLISYIKSNIATFMIDNKISFLDVTSYLTDLSRCCNDAVANEFEQYGIEIINLCIETISPPPSDYESLKRMKERYAMGREIYESERRFNLLDKLAENSSNPAMVMGAGLGMGAAAAREMVGAFEGVMTKPAPSVDANSIPCPHCSTPVPKGQKFCGECGGKMEKKCPSCGTVWEPTQKFCGECGTKL